MSNESRAVGVDLEALDALRDACDAEVQGLSEYEAGRAVRAFDMALSRAYLDLASELRSLRAEVTALRKVEGAAIAVRYMHAPMGIAPSEWNTLRDALAAVKALRKGAEKGEAR